MSTLSTTNLCPTCKYWDNDGVSPYGLCRFYPPTGSGWGRTGKLDWCAQWQAAPTAREKMIEAQYAPNNANLIDAFNAPKNQPKLSKKR
jgi:hypothetical protein